MKDDCIIQSQINPGAKNAERGYHDTSNSGVPPIESNDPWKHRSIEMKCRTCMYYVVKKIPPELIDSVEVGRCRRNAPSMKGYPAVFPTDWCGDHKIDESKLLCG